MAHRQLSIRKFALPRMRDAHDGRFLRFPSSRILLAGALLVWSASPSYAQGQSAGSASGAGNSLGEHYDAAQNFQAAGDLAEASSQYKMFLAGALAELARGHAAAGDFEKAERLFEEAVQLTPGDSQIRLAYAGASFDARDYTRAKSLAEEVLHADPRNAKAHLALGRALMRLNQNTPAREQFEAAIAIDPNFENGYALATAYLALKQEASAARIFAEMLSGLGDTAEIHLSFGRAYADAGLPDQAIQEFKTAIARDGKLPSAHYCLGAAYLQSMGEIDDSQAAAEFEKELQINPDDFLSHLELGSIDLTDHNLTGAIAELTGAEGLDAQNPDAPLFLAQAYMEMNRPGDAEAEFQKSILLTHDVARNHYQVQRAHYMLGRMDLQNGHEEEGQKEIQIAAELGKRSALENQGRVSSAPEGAQDAEAPNREALGKVDAFEKQLAAPIADSYDNLGAMAAGGRDFPDALLDFRAAYEWNPTLDGLDYNWGKAAFSGEHFEEAVGPLGRYLASHPDDTWARSALGMSLYKLKKYADALGTFQTIEPLLDADLKTALAYAVCLVKAGDVSRGLVRLTQLATANPGDTSAHQALGEAFSSQGNFAAAAAEFRAALKLSPSNADLKYSLAVALLGLKQKAEAGRLLIELVESHSQNSDVYYQLGKLQLERGEAKAAVSTLVAGAKVSPGSAPIHFELAAAYQKDARRADAARETRLYEALESKQPGANDPAKPE
jgi:tetratricopeptide (TPR) repeat protein